MRALGLLMQLSIIGGALEVDLLEDFCQQLQASGVPAQEVHIMPVGKFEKPENAMRTPIYNSGGGGDRNSSRKGGRGGGRCHRYDNAFTERQECSNMQGCHQLQIHLIVLTDNMMAHEMDRKLQTGEEEGFKDELRTAVQNNVNQWAQSDPSLEEWVKENETHKIFCHKIFGQVKIFRWGLKTRHTHKLQSTCFRAEQCLQS